MAEEIMGELDLSKVDVNAERIKAIITIIVTAAVNVCNVLGYAVDVDTWLNAVLSIASAILIFWTWWKNQNITLEAAQSQMLLDALKAENKKAKHAKEE
jgi:hypothetical protein